MLVKKNKNSIIFTSTNNNEFNFNSKYIFEYYVNNNSSINVFFIINDSEKKEKLEHIFPKKIIDTRTIKGKIIALNSKFWLTSTLDLPVLSLFKDHSRVVFHMGHGIPLKKIGLNENKINFIKYINRRIRTRQFTHAISYSEKLKPEIKKIFKNKDILYLNIGQPRNDCLYQSFDNAREKILDIINHDKENIKLILYCPTWRPYGQTMIFPFPDFDLQLLNKSLCDNNTYLLVRGHPFFNFTTPEKFAYTSNIISFSTEKISDITSVLCGFDMLITDYSSIYLDFISTNKKIAFIPYDIEKYNDLVGFSFDYDHFTPGDKLHSQKELIDFILSDDRFTEERKEIINDINLKNNNCQELMNILTSYQNKK